MLKTVVLRKGERMPTPDPYGDVLVSFAAPPVFRPLARQSVLVTVMRAARAPRPRQTDAEREHAAMEDGRHTLGGF